MAENKNSFIKSKMNKDLDDRLVPNNEYRDAKNIAVSRSEDQDVGALEAVLGNEIIINSAAGQQCIGTFVDDASGYVYFFLTDYEGSTLAPSTANCSINRWQPSSNTTVATVLASGSYLNFSTANPMHGINLLESLLFFTDNRNQPRVINVVTATQNPNYYNSEESVSVAKFSPYVAPALIDLRSVSALKPSTMSDAENLPSITIGSIIWATDNLDVTRYRNGDLIPQAESFADWTNFDTLNTGCWCYYENQLSNGVIYQKLYNRHAVTDTRNLAPYGYRLAEEADYTNLITETQTTAPASLKSTDFWSSTAAATNNTSGWDGTPSGERSATASNNDFNNLTTQGKWWVADANKYFYLQDNNNAPTIVANTGTKQGYAVRVIQEVGFKGWQGDPELLRDKFIRFSYRFRFDDGEYSIIAPFTQECFIPQHEGEFLNEDEDDTMRSTIVKFMQNNINNIILNIELPSLNIIDDYKINEIDIIYKESDALAYKILQSVEVNPQFITNLNNTNIYQYTYQSTVPFKTLPTDETTRVYDKVPVKALAQAIAGNRVMYANFTQGYNAPLGLNYAVGLSDRVAQIAEEYPQHSVKQNRNYQVGIILADKWGRQTDVILSSKDNVLIAGGEPTEGSNYFTTYRPVENASQVQGWTGENLNIRFDSIININGDTSGLYAQPSLYTVEGPMSSPFPAFFNWSTQELNTVANQAAYTFLNLSYQDLNASTLFTLWLNEGKGWIQVASNTYAVTDSGNDEITITFSSGAPAAANYKLRGRVLYNSQYRYQIENFGLTVSATTELFGAGKYLRGKYQDYVEVESFSQQGSADRYLFFTNEEIDNAYMFQGDTDPSSNPSTRTEPKTFLTVNNYTFDINVNGFYSYRVVVKQQQQEFYNVYLPGIVSGYPIQGNTTEIGSTAFVTLIHDNINKVPRQLKEISNQDVQFNSELTWFGRVTNNSVLTAGNNQQYGPNTTPDSVELIGAIKDVFPGLAFAAAPSTAGEINDNAIFDVESKPFIAKVNVQKAIGVQQAVFNTQAVGSEYPDSMSLSVYETSPTVSNLDLFYETSTSGLISDINTAIVSSGTAIIGLSTFTWLHNEGDCAGSDLTTPFFALTPQGNDVTSTAILSSVYSFDLQDQVDTSVNRNSEFQIVAAGGGSWKIQLVDPHAALLNFEFLEKYQFNIQFTQADGTVSNQTFVRTLLNDLPVIDLVTNPQPGPTQSTILKATGNAFNGIGLVKGFNGSCNTCDRTRDLQWTIQSARWQNGSGVWYSYITGTNTTAPTSSTDIATYYFIKAQGQENQTTCTGNSPENFYGIWLERKTNVSGQPGTLQGDFFAPNLHEVTIQLTDQNGTGASSILAIQFTPTATTYSNVVASSYTASTVPSSPFYINPANHWQTPPTGTGMAATCPTATSTPVLPTWVGEIANWTSNTVYIYAKTYSQTSTTFVLNATFGGYNTQDTTGMNAPAEGDGTRAFTGPITINHSTAGVQYHVIGTLAAFNPSPLQQNNAVVPGDSGNVGDGPFDWSDCTWINNKITWTSLSTCGANARLTLVYDTVLQNPPPSPQNVQAVSNTSPPFHTTSWYKTTGWPS